MFRVEDAEAAIQQLNVYPAAHSAPPQLSASLLWSFASRYFLTHMEDAQMQEVFCPQVKATLRLGSEAHSVVVNNGNVCTQLVSMKEQSMSILKDYITRHNVPNDVPDEPEGIFSEDEEEDSSSEKPSTMSKKRK
ncbi:hypothetical protein DM860_012302 [Cuscuta australis]|uniref:Uncharacterized protein n=1 Tax=Cuscuta australis TaxID=267555 RepID=A0A328DPU2_9ASTE|nr:hypothetical protein DM860_012302 [Cuscuta australis]